MAEREIISGESLSRHNKNINKINKINKLQDL